MIPAETVGVDSSLWRHCDLNPRGTWHRRVPLVRGSSRCHRSQAAGCTQAAWDREQKTMLQCLVSDPLEMLANQAWRSGLSRRLAKVVEKRTRASMTDALSRSPATRASRYLAVSDSM